MPPRLTTERLVLRGWQVDDAPAALKIYGNPDVVRWLSPAVERVPDLETVRQLLRRWIDEDTPGAGLSGRWAIERRSDGRIVGGVVLLPLPPRGDDLEIGWQFAAGGVGPRIRLRVNPRHRRLGVRPGTR